mmetsp:Transcript_16177/g.37386  ORF Transcript_16177/g.37386 Transcript_16177/m.37386 type:complete len:242 (-) Transcript_16177:769-1494(-)
MAVHLDARLVVLDVHVSAFAVKVSLPLVLPRQNGVQYVAPARKRELHGADLRAHVLVEQRLPGLELLQSASHRRLDALVVLLNVDDLVFNRREGVDRRVLCFDAVHDTNQLVTVLIKPLPALSLAAADLDQLLLALIVLLPKDLLQGASGVVEAPLVVEQALPLLERPVPDLVHLANKLLLAVHHHLHRIDLLLEPELHLGLDAHSLVQRAGGAHHVACVLVHPVLPLQDPRLDIAMANVV